MKNEITTKVVGATTYVNHAVNSMSDARQIADSICTQSMLPVYFGTGYAVDRAHIQRMDYGSELVLRFFLNGEDRSGSADDYSTVHSFVVEREERSVRCGFMRPDSCATRPSEY